RRTSPTSTSTAARPVRRRPGPAPAAWSSPTSPPGPTPRSTCGTPARSTTARWSWRRRERCTGSEARPHARFPRHDEGPRNHDGSGGLRAARRRALRLRGVLDLLLRLTARSRQVELDDGVAEDHVVDRRE